MKWSTGNMGRPPADVTEGVSAPDRRTLLAHAAAGMLTASAMSSALARDENDTEPLDHVDPEVRVELLKLPGVTAAPGDASPITTETLPLVRRAAVPEPEFLSAPPVSERFLPARGGAPDIRVFVIHGTPRPDGSRRPAILHTHGGGMVIGTARAGVPGLQPFAAAHDCTIVTVDYRLAPETPYPGSLEDNYTALLWLAAEAEALGIDRNRIVLMGESAGGGHAATLAIAARDRREVPVAFQLLVQPMLDDRTGSSRPVRPGIGTFVWNAAANRFGWTALLGVPAGETVVPSGAVPARVADLSGLPPAFISVGSRDLFVDESIDYAKRLEAAGVPVELHVWPGGVHGFEALAPNAAISRASTDARDTALRRALGRR